MEYPDILQRHHLSLPSTLKFPVKPSRSTTETDTMADYIKDKEKPASVCPGDTSPEIQIGEVKDVKNADAALDFLRHEEGNNEEMTDEDEKRLVRKIDWMVMPLMWSCYWAQYLDKTLINYAAVMGLYEDANITKLDFSNLAWIFYLSYLLFEFPHGYGMQRFPTAKYLGIMVICWGVCVTTTAACHNVSDILPKHLAFDDI